MSANSCLISIVTPAFNEEQNVPLLYGRLCRVLDDMPVNWEWIVVDDHSRDQTFAVVAELARQDFRVRGIRLARNFGSHMAVTCGLRHVTGDCAIIMAADLQDPPETLPALTAKWREGAQVVWAVRAAREGENPATIGFARLYYWIMRRVVGLQEMPGSGADFFLIDRSVVEAFLQFQESNMSLMAHIIWMGFRQDCIYYDKQARLHGASGWSLEKRLKLVVDSVTSFSYLPIRCMSYAGSIIALMGFAYSGLLVRNAWQGHPVEGWTSLMVVVLVLGGLEMLMMGVLGEYLWRTLDESRRRPRYLIENTTRKLVGEECSVLIGTAPRSEKSGKPISLVSPDTIDLDARH